MPEHLTEQIADWRSSVVVERAAHSIRNVALAGTHSKNGYRYADAALRMAAPLYENVPVFLDHPASTRRPRERSTRDLAGHVAGVGYEDGRLRGDVRTLDTEAGRTLLALAESGGPGVGMSHVVLAERSADGATVERIVEVISVDAVVFPATTQSFRESTHDDGRSGDAAISRSRADSAPLSARKEMKRRCRKSDRIGRVRMLMNDSRQQRSGVPVPTEPPVSPERPASVSETGRSAPTSHPRRPGSLERLLASVDARLPGHLRRLAAASGAPGRGRGVRVGVFPTHIVVEWRSAAGLPEHYAVAWHLDGHRIVFGDALIPIDEFTEQTTWRDVLSSITPSNESRRRTLLNPGSSSQGEGSQREGRSPVSTPSPAPSEEDHGTPHANLERLTEQLRQTAAERDRLAARLAERSPTSLLRRPSQRDAVADEQFVRTIRRR